MSLCFCPRCWPREIASLHEVAPRLAKARDELIRSEIERQARKQARIAAARERKQAQREKPDVAFCGKVRYPSAAEAREARMRQAARVRLYVYECAGCGGWHLSKHRHVRWAKAQEVGAPR